MSRGEKSFSLVEMVVTITVLGMVIAGIIPIISSSFRRAELTRRQIVAHRFAQERVENLELTNLSNDFYDNLFYANGTPLNNVSFQDLGNASVSGDEGYGNLSLNSTDPDDPFMHFRRLTEGCWDIDQDGNLTNETTLGWLGNLSLLRVSVFWDFNNDNVDDGNIFVITQKSAY